MRFSRLLSAGLVAAATLTSCQTDAVMWGECAPAANGDTSGTDGTHVLDCVDGVWVPVMTNDEFVRSRRGEDVVVAPLPTKPVSNPVTATTTTSTTTTTVPAPLVTVRFDTRSGDYAQATVDGTLVEIRQTSRDSQAYLFVSHWGDGCDGQPMSYRPILNVEGTITQGENAVRVSGANKPYYSGWASGFDAVDGPIIAVVDTLVISDDVVCASLGR